MPISIKIDPIVSVFVEGSLTDRNGVENPFKFRLICHRLTEAAIEERMSNFSGSIRQFAVQLLGDVINDWSGVMDDDRTVPYSLSAWHELCNIPHLPLVALKAYRERSGATSKN